MIVDPRPQSTVEPWMIKYMGPTVPTGDEQKSSGFGTGSIIGGTLIGGGLIGGGIMAAKYFKNRATDKAGSPRLLGTGIRLLLELLLNTQKVVDKNQQLRKLEVNLLVVCLWAQ